MMRWAIVLPLPQKTYFAYLTLEEHNDGHHLCTSRVLLVHSAPFFVFRAEVLKHHFSLVKGLRHFKILRGWKLEFNIL